MGIDRTKYPKILHLDKKPSILDNSLTIFEKLDGANCQISSLYEHLITGARSGENPTNLRRASWWNDFNSWVHGFYGEQQRKLNVQLSKLVPENFVYYGEWLSPHTLDYPKDVENQFYLIDVFDRETKKFLPYDEAVDVATYQGRISLNTLTPLFQGRISRDKLPRYLNSSQYRVGNKEGIVLKDYENQQFAKLPREEFDELRRTKSGIEKYLSPNRLKKAEQRLTDSGKIISYHAISEALCRDIREEAGEDIYNRELVLSWLNKELANRGRRKSA